MLTTWPSPDSRRAGSRARVIRSVPRTLVSHMVRQVSSPASSMRSRPRAPPALFTSRWTTAGSSWTKAATLCASVTSSGSAVAPSGPATSRRRSRRRAPTQSSNPACARARAVAAPIPELAPVTTAVFPSLMQSSPCGQSPLHLGRGTEIGHRTGGALGFARLAESASMALEQVRPGGPVLARQKRQEIALDLFRIGLLGQAEPPREPLDVGVDRDPLVLAEGVAEDRVGGLPPDAGELHEGLH